MKKLATAIKTAEVKAVIHRKPFVVSEQEGCFYVQALSLYPFQRQAEIILANLFNKNCRELIIRPK